MPYIEYYSCTKKPSCPAVPPGKFSSVVYATVDELQRHIITYGAVVTGFFVHADFFAYWGDPMSFNSNGVYIPDTSTELMGGHAVLVVRPLCSGRARAALPIWQACG